MAPIIAPPVVKIIVGTAESPAIPADVSVANQLPAVTRPNELCIPAAMLPAVTPIEPKPTPDKIAGTPKKEQSAPKAPPAAGAA